MTLKIAVIGASSKTGEALLDFFTELSDVELFAFTREHHFSKSFGIRNLFDTSPLNVKEFKKIIFDIKPDVVINTIGLNDEQECEKDKPAAWKLNVTAVENLVKVAKICECKFIQISSDKIFSGVDGPYVETARPEPASYFGKTKLAAENVIISYLQNYAIIRVNGLFGYTSFGKFDFVSDILQNLENSKQVYLRNDDLINPLITDDLAAVIGKIVKKDKTGIYNAGNHDIVSSYEFGRIIADVFGLDSGLINEAKPTKKDKNRRYGLITLKTETDLGVKLPTNRKSLYFFKHKIKK